MKIDQAIIFKFFFPYEGTEIMIPMAAASQDEAVNKLRVFMLGWASDLQATSAPTLSPIQPKPVEERAPDPLVLAMRIEELVTKLIPIKKPKGASSIEKLVKDWTGFPYEPQNYASIIAELGRMDAGQ